MVEFVYKSWLKVRQGWMYQLRGQERWLSMLRSDEELIVECDRSIEEIKPQATVSPHVNNVSPTTNN